jgi:hypothetical protein
MPKYDLEAIWEEHCRYEFAPDRWHNPAPCRRARHEVKIGCHASRATGITAYLEAGGTLEHAQEMTPPESPRTAKLYDHTGLDEVERITI